MVPNTIAGENFCLFIEGSHMLTFQIIYFISVYPVLINYFYIFSIFNFVKFTNFLCLFVIFHQLILNLVNYKRRSGQPSDKT